AQTFALAPRPSSGPPTLSPFNAWVFLKGLETLRLRMQAHCAAAQQLAEWLEQQPQVEHVYYAGLPSHPQHALACRQQTGFGAVSSEEHTSELQSREH